MLLRILSMMCLFCCTVCFSSEILNSDDSLLNEIIANDCEVIVDVVDGKIYINPDRIFPTTQGMFLHLNANKYVSLPILYSDSRGCYIPPAVKVAWPVIITTPCKFCGWGRVSGAWKCRNPNCPSNQPR